MEHMWHACAFSFHSHLPVAWAPRAPLKPLKAAGGLTACRELSGKDHSSPTATSCVLEGDLVEFG